MLLRSVVSGGGGAASGLPIPSSPYNADKGAIIFDGVDTVQGSTFHIFNQSRNDSELATDGYTLIKPNSCTIVEGSGYLQMTGDGAVQYLYWGSPVLNTAPTIHWSMDWLMAGRTILLYTNINVSSYGGASVGGSLLLHTGTSPTSSIWYQLIRQRNGTNTGWEVSAYKSPNTGLYLSSTAGAQVGWAAIRITPSDVYIGYNNQAFNAYDSVEPEAADFTWVAQDNIVFGSYGLWLRPALYLTANPGNTVTTRFGRLMFRIL